MSEARALREDYSNIYCFHCDKNYNAKESTAEEQIMFCSRECELEEEQRLREGNEIVKEAVELDPVAGLQMGLKPSPKAQEQAILDIVDAAFLNMKSKVPGEKA